MAGARRCNIPKALVSTDVVAAYQDTPYNIVLLVHLFSVIVGVGVAFAMPILAVRARRDAGKLSLDVIDEMAGSVVFPMLLLAGIAGGALVGMSSDVFDFSQTWLSIGGAIWMLTLVLALAVYPPRWLPLFNLVEDRKRMLGGILHLSLAVMLVLMVFKFGGPF